MIMIKLTNPKGVAPLHYTVAGLTLDEAVAQLYWGVLSWPGFQWSLTPENCCVLISIESAGKNRFVRAKGQDADRLVDKIRSEIQKLKGS